MYRRRSLAGHCEVAARLGDRLGLGGDVHDALGHAYERWDGRGHPSGQVGDEAPWAVRVVAAARDAELWSRQGWDAAAKIGPNSYYAHRKWPPSKRALRDAELKVEIGRVYDANMFVHGAAKIWAQLNTEGTKVGAVHRRATDARDGPVGEPAQDLDGHD